MHLLKIVKIASDRCKHTITNLTTPPFVVYTCGAALLCALVGNQLKRAADDWLVMQPEDVTDLHYRPVDGDSKQLSQKLEAVTTPFKSLKEIRPDEKAQLSHTSAAMLPVKWSAGAGATSMQIWSSTPRLTKQKVEIISHRTPFYYGYPEGPSTAINKLRVKGSGNEKEQIVLNNGYQDLLGKVFPIMDLTQRNAIALQEMIIEKTKTPERMTKSTQCITLAAADVGELQLQAFQTNMLFTHMRHEFHELIGKQFQAATKLTGQMQEMQKNAHGDMGLGAGSTTELKALKEFQDKKRKSDFRTGAEAMTCPVVPTNAKRAAATSRNSTSAVLAIMIGVVAIALVAVAVVAAEDAAAADAAADAAKAAAAKAAGASLRTAPQSTQTTRVIWRTTSRIFGEGAVPSTRTCPPTGARSDDAIQQANERLGTAEAASTATAQASATATRVANPGAGQRDTTRGPSSNEHGDHGIRHVHGATKGPTRGGLRRVAATFVDGTVAVGKERAAAHSADDRGLDERSDRRALDTTRAPTRAPSTCVPDQPVGTSDRGGHKVLPDPNTATAQDTKPPTRGARSQDAGADDSPLASSGRDRPDQQDQVDRIQGQETKTVLSSFVLDREERQGWGLLLGGRDHRRQLLAGVPQRQAYQPVPPARPLQGAQPQDVRRGDHTDASGRRHVYDVHGRIGGLHDGGAVRSTTGDRRAMASRDEPAMGQDFITRPGVFQHTRPGVREHGASRISDSDVHVWIRSEPIQLAEAIQPGARLLDTQGRGLDGYGNGRQHRRRHAPHEQRTGNSEHDQEPADRSGCAPLLRHTAIAEGRASHLPHDGEEVQRYAVRLSASAEVDRRCEENEHPEVSQVLASATPAQEAGVGKATGNLRGQGRSSESDAVWCASTHKPAATSAHKDTRRHDDIRAHGLSAAASSGAAEMADQDCAQRIERYDDDPRETSGLQGDHGFLRCGSGRSTAANGADTEPANDIDSTAAGVAQRMERCGRDLRRRGDGAGVRKTLRVARLHRPTGDGQHRGNLLLEQTGPFKRRGAERDNETVLGVLSTTRNNGNSYILSRGRDSSRRAEQESGDGVGILPTTLDFRDIGADSPGRKRCGDVRSVRLDGQCADEEVRIANTRSVRGVGGLHKASMGTGAEQVLRLSSSSTDEDPDRESSGRGADAAARVTSMDETAPPAHHRDADRGAAGDPMDGADGTEPTRGQVQDEEGAIGRELVPMAPGWVSNIRQQARVRGTAAAAAEAYIERLAGKTTNIVEVYDRWERHCKSLGVDPVRASDDAILSAADAYAHAIEKDATIKISLFNSRMRVVSNIYNHTRKLDINTKVVKDVRKGLTKSKSRGQQRVTTRSFNSGRVFQALADFYRNSHFGISTDAAEIYYRRMFIFAGRTDGCSRSDDIKHLLWNTDCIQPLTQYGVRMELSVESLRRCHSLRLAYQGSKTTGTRLTTACTVNKARARHTTDHELKDTALALANYVAETWEKRQLLHPLDEGAVLISSTKCQRRARTWRFDPIQGKKVPYDWPCGGRCGKYHALSADAIAKDTTWCLEQAQVDTREFKSHQSRGNAETVIIYASRFSDEFDADEAKVRARHSDTTQNKYYLRQPDPEFMTKINRLQQNKRRKMFPEEYLRL